jgi:Cu2+-exporting ATPase
VSAAVTTLDVAAPPAIGRSKALCAHCGAPLPGDAAGEFCCGGCASAFAFVRELGLQRYYDARRLDPSERRPRPPEESAEDATAYAVSGADGTTSLALLVDGLHCAACVWLIEQVLARDPAVMSARVNLTSRRLTLRWTGGAETAPRLVQTVQRVGYRAVPFDAEQQGGTSDEERSLLRAVAVAGFATANVMLLSVSVWAGFSGEMGPATRDLMHWISALISLPAIAYAGRPFFRSAFVALRAWRTNMDVPISVGVTLAAALSLWETARSGDHAYFESVVMLLFFLLLGRYLDRRARGRVRSAAEHLVRFARAPATVLGADGSTRRASSASLKPGDTVLIAAGERVPADGRVTLGSSSLDRSLVDGETMPAPVAPGSEVLAGMLNLSAPLRVLVAAVGERTYLAEVVRLMEAAERGRARLVALSDRVARRYAPAVHLLALATFLGWALAGPWQAALLNAVAVLIITCPCALGLAVPVVQVVASNRLFRRGILLKSATALERLAEVDTVVFDKTGTLTLGRPELGVDCVVDGKDIELASGLAARSRHPLSRALRRAAPDAPALEDVQERPGHGLSRAVTGGELRLGSRRWCGIPDPESEDDIDAEFWLVAPGRTPAQFRFRDALRPDAADIVDRLRARGMRVMVLSGDRPAAVSAVAEALGISDWRAGVTPADKVHALESLAAQGAKVLMVGDGLNDGPALAAAGVSMSPSSAADVCQTAADVVFQGASLRAVLEVLDVARRSGRVVRENIGFALAYNLAAVPLAMAGLVTPLLAAAAMSCSSILVVTNSLRLGRGR